MGPRGNSLKRLQEETLTKMSILGKGSMRDKAKVKVLEAMAAALVKLHNVLSDQPQCEYVLQKLTRVPGRVYKILHMVIYL